MNLNKNNSVLILDGENKKPIGGNEVVYFIWYLPEGTKQYHILLKTFRKEKSVLLKPCEAVKQRHNICGIGEWNMFNGQLKLYKEHN